VDGWAILICVVSAPVSFQVPCDGWVEEVVDPTKGKHGEEVTTADDVGWVNKIKCVPRNTRPQNKSHPGIVLQNFPIQTRYAMFHPPHPQNSETLWFRVWGNLHDDMIDREDVGIELPLPRGAGGVRGWGRWLCSRLE
jgi:hypothetical protein